MSSEVKTRLSADNSQYKSVLDESVNYAGTIAGRMANKFEFRDVGRTLATSLGLNLEKLAEKAARLFTGLSESQEEAYKSIDQLSSQVADRQIKAMHERLSLEDQYKISLGEQESLEKRIADNVFTSAEKQAERLRDQLALLDKQAESKALAQKMDAAASESATKRAELLLKQEETIAKAKEQWDEQERARSEKNAAEDLKWYQERTRLESQLHAQKIEALAPEERVLALRRDITDIERQRAKYEKDSNDYKSLSVKLTEINKSLESEQAAIVAQRAADEERITQEKKKQANEEKARAAWAGSIRIEGRGNEDLSDRELERKITLIKADIFRRELALRQSTPTVGDDPAGPMDPILNGIQRPTLNAALAEQNLRNSTRQSVRNVGEDRAFQMFGGSEQRFREIIQAGNAGTDQKLGDIYNLLKNQGIKTIDISRS